VKFPTTRSRLPGTIGTSRSTFPQPGGRNLVDWLGHGQSSAQMLATARQLLALEQAVQQTLSPALRQVCRVARLDKQQLTLVVPGAIQASRLRQLTPRILEKLTADGWHLSAIVIKIQARTFQPPAPPPGKEAIALNEEALRSFDALHTQLPSGVLAEAVERLLRRHRQAM